MFHCYGRRTNRYLLGNYGFSLENNKYNSLAFRVWLDFNDPNTLKSRQEEREKAGKNNDDYDSEDEDIANNRVQKTVRLKMYRLREDVFGYLRASLMQKADHKHKSHLLVSTPVDPEFELLVVACAINLLQGLHKLGSKQRLKKIAQF